MHYMISANRKLGRSFIVDDKTEKIRGSDLFPKYMERFFELTNRLNPDISFKAIINYEGTSTEFTNNYKEFKDQLDMIKNRIDMGWNDSNSDWFDFSITVFEQ